jgi:L-methionine (R)-S-oxide reductase
MINAQEAAAFLRELDGALAGAADAHALAMQLIARHFDHYQWVGIYWLDGDQLILGPYVGQPTDHRQIAVGQGVCGTAIAKRENQLVADVREVANYLACSATTRSEIVVLIRRDGKIIGQIDADSDQVSAFDRTDEALLSAVAERLAARRAQSG